MQTYHASCHCGRVRFRIEADLSQLTRCTLLDLQQRRLSRHLRAARCGMHPFRNPRSNPEAYAVNVRCLDDFDLDSATYEVKLFDGRNWEAAQEARVRASAKRS